MSGFLGNTAFRYCGRTFTSQEIGFIRHLIASKPDCNRAQLSRLVCDELSWFRPNGEPKEMSCRVAMLRMERDGLFILPSPKTVNGNGRIRPRCTSLSAPGKPVSLPANKVGELRFVGVDSSHNSPLWNEVIERYHYLGYKPLTGAQIRYLVFAGETLVAALGFGAAAWTVAPRDSFIGWSSQQRQRNLHLIANNARFLILPWVNSKNLASSILAAVAKRLPLDWQNRYHHQIVLLETFVDKTRYAATCYRAANWILVGQTKGLGKVRRKKRLRLPVKDIYLYPLHRNYRKKLLYSPPSSPVVPLH